MLSSISVIARGTADHIAKKWIQDIKLKEGRFTTYCKKNGFEGPCKACADKALQSKDPSVRGMANFWMNVAKDASEGRPEDTSC
jgi:hypothetical protein